MQNLDSWNVVGEGIKAYPMREEPDIGTVIKEVDFPFGEAKDQLTLNVEKIRKKSKFW